MIYAFLSRLLRDCSGFGAMELGLSSPFLFLLSLGMIDASLMVGTKIDHELAAQRTTDFALAKRPGSGDAAYLVDEAASISGVEKDDVSVEIYRTCDGIKADKFEGVCTAGQTTARYVSVAISKAIPTKFDWSALAGTLGIRVFEGAIVVTGDSVVRFQ